MGTTKATFRTAGSVILDWVEESMMLAQLGKGNAAHAHSLRAQLLCRHSLCGHSLYVWAGFAHGCGVSARLRLFFARERPRSRRASDHAIAAVLCIDTAPIGRYSCFQQRATGMVAEDDGGYFSAPRNRITPAAFRSVLWRGGQLASRHFHCEGSEANGAGMTGSSWIVGVRGA